MCEVCVQYVCVCEGVGIGVNISRDATIETDVAIRATNRNSSK